MTRVSTSGLQPETPFSSQPHLAQPKCPLAAFSPNDGDLESHGVFPGICGAQGRGSLPHQRRDYQSCYTRVMTRSWAPLSIPGPADGEATPHPSCPERCWVRASPCHHKALPPYSIGKHVLNLAVFLRRSVQPGGRSQSHLPSWRSNGKQKWKELGGSKTPLPWVLGLIR